MYCTYPVMVLKVVAAISTDISKIVLLLWKEQGRQAGRQQAGRGGSAVDVTVFE